MVWWIDSNRYYACRSKFFYYAECLDILNDRIFQTTNIIYSLHNHNYEAFEINSLIKSGVNIFNVDFTVLDKDFFQKVKELIIASENANTMHPDRLRSPIGLAITITVNELVDIDERVDIIILKDVSNLKNFLDFKKKIQNTYEYIPIIVCLKLGLKEGLKSIIEYSDGVLLDVTKNNNILENNLEIEEFTSEVVDLCKQAYKPAFSVINDILKDYQSTCSADYLHILSIANNVNAYFFDGIMLAETDNVNKNESIQSIVRAFDVAENKTKYDTDVYKLSFQIRTPVLPWISTALAASIAAKQCNATAIIVLTVSGMSARWISKLSPPCHILAVTSKRETARRLHLYRKVIPIFYKHPDATCWALECWNRVEFGTTTALHIGLCVPGDKIVIHAPFDQNIQYCNGLQILSLPLRCEN